MEAKKVLNTASGKMLTVGGQQYNKLIKQGYTRQGNALIPPASESSSDELEEIEEKIENVRTVLERPTFVERDINYETFGLPPVRCIECNKVLANLYKPYKRLEAEGITPLDIFAQLDIKRPCCRMQLLQPQQMTLLEYNPYLVEGDKPLQPRPTKLGQNPLLQPQSQQPITYIEGHYPPMLTNKIIKNHIVSYEPNPLYLQNVYDKEKNRPPRYSTRRSQKKQSQPKQQQPLTGLQNRPIAGGKYHISYK